MVVGIGVGLRAVAISDADTGRTDRVVESCMAVRARASQLVVVLVCMAGCWCDHVLRRECYEW